MSITRDPKSSLFQDLTHIFIEMKDCRHVDVEAAVERRLREYMRSAAGSNTRGLQITLTWALPDGPGDWALQATGYKTLSQQQIADVFPGTGKRRGTSASRARLRALLGKIGGRSETLERPGIWHQIPYQPACEEPVLALPKPRETADVVPFPGQVVKRAERDRASQCAAQHPEKKKGW